MLRVFCDRKGSGKTKALIKSANEEVSSSEGSIVYINDDNKPMLKLDRRIRFISAEEYELNDYNDLYGFLCGILSQNYDIITVYIDGLFNITENSVDDVTEALSKIEELSQRQNIGFYLNIDVEKDIILEGIKNMLHS